LVGAIPIHDLPPPPVVSGKTAVAEGLGQYGSEEVKDHSVEENPEGVERTDGNEPDGNAHRPR